ncbi:hypothetical protein Ddye_019441 [Dipteronia dyeriana]|uniref:Receptor-like serine/threonine-protein kinase n=1 Tax=Dipteronia dyeriana TaxID=168575 RepID=A0AAD9TXY9_9ROSI|nr:hypothetical protein Ddye_019441 [Dipteronia dyeriana]
MEPGNSGVLVVVIVLLFCFCLDFGAAVDTITASRSIRDPESIISSGNAFKLGFFSPGNSSNRYVGIWYNDASEAVIWVANRNRPLNGASGVVNISDDGRLVVLNEQREVLWSSNVSNSVANARAQLLDSGNLVLYDNNNGSIWQSFDEPTNTFMRRMKLTTNVRTGENVMLTSWKSPSDPSIGSFSAGLNLLNIPQVFTWNNNTPFWRSGQWNGREFIGITNVTSVYLGGFELVENKAEGTASLSFEFAIDSTTYFVLDTEGRLLQNNQVDGKEWQIRQTYPENVCDVYGKCGEFGICGPRSEPICTCLGGFEPKNIEEWSRGNWTNGCGRRTPLQCESINKTGDVGKEDGFLKFRMLKLPDFAERTTALEDRCRELCLSNCSCLAYAYDAGIGCMSWRDNLTDVQQFYSKGTDFYIRVAHSELAADKNDMKVVIIVPVVVGAVVIAISAFFLWRWMAKRKAMKEKSSLLKREERSRNISDENKSKDKLQDLPLFDFEKLATATKDFHLTNKLGEGGFGPVYKGVLEDGQEIAVKRLSKASGQGIEEFMNEVMVISKLQHRNLVRLLGCCIEGEEKMLIYEFMPNKSLDAFLFDPEKRKLLDWSNRFNIIEGISRGLLYLHRDSRLRIIHRDLKASNILLDEELNPKISDFGMARIFGGNQDQANTIRVVGTYGYMSPEYAMEGRFSEKSDVFSFGVLLLEIVSGRRNAGFYQDDLSLSLIGYVWKLWNENHIVATIDTMISDPLYQSEVLRCIHVGLLCVQEFVKDRPTMSTVISMLNSEILDLPTPKQPAFIESQGAFETESSDKSLKKHSVNYVSITVVDGR